MNTYKIRVHDNTDGSKFSWADYRDEFNIENISDFRAFREFLMEKKVAKINLKFIDLRTNKPQMIAKNIDTDLLYRNHFDWLTSTNWYQYKYVELVALDKRFEMNFAA